MYSENKSADQLRSYRHSRYTFARKSFVHSDVYVCMFGFPISQGLWI